MKVNKLFRVIISNFRVLIERIKGHSVTTKSIKLLLSPKTEISIRDNGRLEMGIRTKTQTGVYLGVRKNAVLHIGDYVGINRNTCIIAHERIHIGDNVIIAPNVCIYDHDHGIKDRDNYITKPIIINSGTWIGANTVILKGVTIGSNCIIGAGSIVTQDIPDNTIMYQKRESVLKMITTPLSIQDNNETVEKED